MTLLNHIDFHGILSAIFIAIIGILTIFIALYFYFQYQYTYWMRKNIFYIEPKFPYGNFKGIGKSFSIGQIMKNIYDSNKGEKVVGAYGLFGSPVLVVRDLDLIRQILIKEFSSFMDRGFLQSMKYDPLTGHLFFLSGRKWRNIRIKLTPTFTSGKMKMMFPTLLNCGGDFKEYLNGVAEKENTIDVKEIMSRFTMDVIASCAFGLEIHCFKNTNSEFRKVGQAFLKPSLLQVFKNNFSFSWPKLARLLKVKIVPKETTEFFIKAVKDTFEYREKNNVQRNDFMQLLIELKNKGRIESADRVPEDADYDPTFSIEEASAQAFGFFVAGFETSSTAMMFCLFELAINHDIQNKLREEIDRVMSKHNGKITYDGLQEMEYLDRVVAETLRKYPPATVLVRECTKHFYMPEINAIIEKGTRILIPLLGLHHDPEYYPNPEKFDPERFTPEMKEGRDPMCYIPFGDGPRICIGNRFALMQTKAGLVIFLSNYKVDVSEKTKIPLEFDPKIPLTGLKGEMHLKVLKR